MFNKDTLSIPDGKYLGGQIMFDRRFRTVIGFTMRYTFKKSENLNI